MLVGAHVSIAGGIKNAPKNSHQIGGDIFQFFSRNPRGGQAKDFSKTEIDEFKFNLKKYNQVECYIHAPYIINLASSKKYIYYSSIQILRQELERGSALGAKYMMTHLGSAKDIGRDKAIKRVAERVSKVLDNYNGSTQLLLELSAGSSMIIGSSFYEIREILKKIPTKIRSKTGICFDTAHAFESGYDLQDKKSVKKTLDTFDKTLGIKKLKLIHINDSKIDLNSRVDRHEHIGKGKIGLPGFTALIKDKRLANTNLIIETPADGTRHKDISLLKKVIKQNNTK